MMQARVEGAIGICNQQTRVALALSTRVALALANASTRLWAAVLLDFRNKRNFF